MPFVHAQLAVVALGYFVLCFLWPFWRIRRQIGKNPITFAHSAGVKAFIGKVFLALVLVEAFAGVVLVFLPAHLDKLVPIPYFDGWLWRDAGFVVMLASIGLTTTAQYQMGKSWRIGIDEREKTGLVVTGLYRCFRHPIYAAMFLGAVGYFLFLPNAVTLCVLTSAYLAIKTEMLLEEEHMSQLHPVEYPAYVRRVRRWL